jgi:hypothetical protein
MKEKIAKLINVKSIVTLALTGLFIFLACKKDTVPQEVMTIYTVIISFYFGTQAAKKDKTETDLPIKPEITDIE